jgi:hypothetical protein
MWKPLLPLAVVAGIVGLVVWSIRLPATAPSAPREVGQPSEQLAPAVDEINRLFQSRWQQAGIVPAATAPELQVLRRLSLALQGTIPSLEEIREFEADRRPDRLTHWTGRMLADPRFADYFAERLARAFVGTEEGQFIIYRRDRFTQWLSGHLQRNTPYDQLVREMVAATGVATGKPAVNFVLATFANDQIDCQKLAGKTVRAFLGQRIDCAQCHDHPFDHWKQPDFEGLAAFYGQARQSIVGLEDKPVLDGQPREFQVLDRQTNTQRVVEPRVPFHPEWLHSGPTRRAQLATWITHPANRRFERAIANRIWGLLFGRAFHEPVDDLRDPPDEPDLLDVLGQDFRAHGCDLRRLIQVITASAPFRLSSEWVSPSVSAESAGEPDALWQTAERQWALFPLIRLRPEQVIGSLLQSSSLQTIDQNSHLFMRFKKFVTQNDFVREYGDLGDGELLDRGGTVPQRLLLMNGKLAWEALKIDPFNSSARINSLGGDDERRVETAYLACLTRRPSREELRVFTAMFAQQPKRPDRREVMEDLFWTLLNSTEFSWNH